MARASEIEKIIIELEERGADQAYIRVKRLNDIMGEISKHKGPSGIAESFEALGALNDRLANSLVEIPGLADSAANAWGKLVGQIRAYNDSQVKKAMRNTDLEASRKDAQTLADQMRAASRIPTELQSASAPKAIDFAAALATQSQKAGSAIEAASHHALDEAVAIGEAAQAATKLSSVYTLIEKRAKATAKADKDMLAAQMKASNHIPTHLQSSAGPKSLTGGQKAFQAFSRTFGPKATQGLVSTVETMEKLGPIAGKIGPPVANVALAMGAVAIAGAGAAIWAGKEFGAAVVGAQGFREDMLTALTAITGTEKKANSTLDAASRTADFLGKKRGETVGQFTALMGKGFDFTGADSVVRGMADLKVKAPTANIEQLVFAIGQIQTKGKLAGEELGQLAEGGIDRGAVLAILAKRMGKSAGDIEKAMQAGKISSKEGIDAILSSISKDGGPLGALANKKSRSDINSLLDLVKAIPENLLFDVKVGPGMDGIKGTLNSIIDWFDPSKGKGKEVRQVAGDLFNAMIEGLTGNKVDTTKGITGTLDAILAGAKEAVPVVRELAGGARDIMSLAGGIAGGIGAVSEFAGGLGNIASIWKGLSFPVRMMMAPFLGPLALLPELRQGYLGLKDLLNGNTAGAKDHFKNMLPDKGYLFDLFSSTGDAIGGLVAQIAASGSSILNAGITYGQNLWQGLVQGITGGIGAVVQSATNLANAALRAVGSKWVVGSPAKAFEDLSLWAGAGTVRGFNRSEAKVASAAASMANVGLSAAWASGQANTNGVGVAMASGGGGGGIVINFSPTIVVSGASSPAQAQAIGAAAVAGSRAQFEAQMGTGLRRLRYG